MQLFLVMLRVWFAGQYLLLTCRYRSLTKFRNSSSDVGIQLHRRSPAWLSGATTFMQGFTLTTLPVNAPTSNRQDFEASIGIGIYGP